MALFARRKPAAAVVSTRATPEQLGDGATPEAHTPNATPAAVEIYGDELPEAVSYAPASARRWRGAETLGRPLGPTDRGEGSLPVEHSHPGAPNERQVWASPAPAGQRTGPVGPDAERFRPQTETVSNFRMPVVIDPQTAPVRPRAGSTGEDPTHAAILAGWSFARGFDKWAAEELAPGGLDKVAFASPIASQPLTYAESIPGALPSPGGDQPTAPVGVVGAQPNSARYLPRAWDEMLINTGQDVQGVESVRRSRGWRAQ